MSTLPKSLIEQAIYMVKEVVLEENVDKVTVNQYGKLVSNLAMLKINASSDSKELWSQLIANLLYPDHNPFPEGLFLVPQSELRHYQLALDAIEEIYNEHG